MAARISGCDGEPSTGFTKRTVSIPCAGSRRFIQCLVLIPLVLVIVSCAAGTLDRLPTRGERAQVEVYLQPVPNETGRLKWVIEGVEAIGSDGTRLPLTLRNSSINGPDPGTGQTLLGWGYLPPGSYSGISLTIKEASMTRMDGDAALLVPENPVFIAGSFKLGMSDVLPLFLTLDHAAGLETGGFRFSPSFSLAHSSRELLSLTGYMAVPEADRITIFNRKTLHVTGALATGRSPMALALDSILGRAYVAVSGDNAIQVVDVLDGVIRERISLQPGDEPVDLALTGDRRVLLSANHGSGTLGILDPVQGTVTQRIFVGRGPTSVTVNRAGTRAYVICSQSNLVSVVDLTTGILSASLVLEETTPFAAALDRDEEKLFIIHRDSAHLTVLDTSTLTITDRTYVGLGSTSLVVDEVSGLVLVGRSFGHEISIIDPFALMAVDTIRLDGKAELMALDPQDNTLLVVNQDKRLLQKIDLVSKRVIAEMDAHPIPSEVSVFE